MASFLLHSETDPQNDLFFVNSNVPDQAESVREYADSFTHDTHEAGHMEEELIPISAADALILLATNSDH